ncbi:helix-turn-helix transcriptional regulator [Lactiplantibacillus pentosus]|uniref:helix-turn-helix transcriptional regulator n=1 Tax=Lactiplantibacillus pentosus TaxID=1589 RepID=UPI0002681515|nr:helix-turn-helix transcriptional regulator [Lactiplantibacillus pentosus]EIW14928.1 Transcriptional regulator, PbsX family [Lactiplantibacillus pentosus KCA1]MBQ0835502.1 helix-turn-helix transcriptional regulator [Lactiplantibacillus pentosus]MBU7464956.1 helix-turn-helix transcriptional regulator [Lactiplantibacillus pentosus]MBU7490960.1 helix-turn-helix transcriptional regulator [Lactiplantibacillus pentosus]MBU7493956.1 helix-turn-helix transcriptional regulator [Lactiplantibacillus pe
MNNIKKLRIQSGLTQIQLARKVRVSRQTISLIEKGSYNPSLKVCLRLALALKTNLNYLFENYYNLHQ